MSEYITTTADLKSVADAIRDKSGTTALLTFPIDFNNVIKNISSGTDISPYTEFKTGSFKLEADFTSGYYDIQNSKFTQNKPALFLFYAEDIYTSLPDGSSYDGYFMFGLASTDGSALMNGYSFVHDAWADYAAYNSINETENNSVKIYTTSYSKLKGGIIYHWILLQ